MAAYYPLFDDDLKQGPPGPPGVGFKLTNDGNYDIEKKILKNVKEPIELNDSATKSYVDTAHEHVKNDLRNLSDKSLIHDEYYNAKDKRITNVSNPINETDCVTKKYVDELESKSLTQALKGNFNAKGKIIYNLRDPVEDKNAVNKRYFEANSLILKDDKFDAKQKIISNVAEPKEKDDVVTKKYYDYYSILWDKDGKSYHAHNERISHLKDPLWNKDAATKEYVDQKTKINDKISDNLLTRDNDGLYVPSLMKNGIYNFGNQRITNVANPIINKDVATKEYVDSQDFYATIKQRYFNNTTGGFKLVEFNLFSSKLLEPNLRLTSNMYMQIDIYLESDQMVNPLIKLEVDDKFILQRPMSTNTETVTCFANGKRNEILKLSILSDGAINNIKPYLHVKKIEFL